METPEELTKEQRTKMAQVLFQMKKNKKKLIKKYGKNAEDIMYRRARKVARQFTPDDKPITMDDTRLRELVQKALSTPPSSKEKIKWDRTLEGCDCQQDDRNDRYMFFSNLQQMRRQCDMLLDLDPNMIGNILDNGHDWAQDHIAEAKSFLDQTFDFFMNETKKHGMQMSMNVDDKDMMSEDRLKKQIKKITETVIQRLKKK